MSANPLPPYIPITPSTGSVVSVEDSVHPDLPQADDGADPQFSVQLYPRSPNEGPDIKQNASGSIVVDMTAKDIENLPKNEGCKTGVALAAYGKPDMAAIIQLGHAQCDAIYPTDSGQRASDAVRDIFRH